MGFEKTEANSSSSGLRPPSATEETPLIRGSKPFSSQSKTFANVFIATVGAGVLGMPYSFKRAGWIMSLLTLVLVAYLTHHCMMLLVYTRRKLEASDASTKITSFGDLGFIVCGSAGRLVVDVLIILAQAGFCVGYLLFIGNTMAHLVNPPTEMDLRTTDAGQVGGMLVIQAAAAAWLVEVLVVSKGGSVRMKAVAWLFKGGTFGAISVRTWLLSGSSSSTRIRTVASKSNTASKPCRMLRVRVEVQVEEP